MKAENFDAITACGECCTDCAKHQKGLCPGCIETDGRVLEWADSGRCRVHACVQAHGARFCGLCPRFPCEELPALIHWNPRIVEHLTALAAECRRTRGQNRT